MQEIPVTNDKDHAIHVGGKMIPPGETRMVDESLLPDAHERTKAETSSEDTSDPLLDILDGNVKSVTDALPGLSAAELDVLEKAETDGNTRKGVISGLAAARLALADQEADQDNETSETDSEERNTEGDETSSEDSAETDSETESESNTPE